MEKAPTREAVLAALTQVPQADVLRAALHLALPVDQVLDLAVTFHRDGSLSWRGVSVVASGRGTEGVVDAVLDLVAGGSRSSDRWLDLSQDRSTWIKPVRSGARTLAFGAGVLFGAPVLAAEAGLPDSCLHAALRCWLESGSVPTVLVGPDSTVLVDEVDGMRVLRALATADAPLAGASDADVDLESWLAREFGADALGYLRTGARPEGVELEYHFQIPGWVVVVPVLSTGSSELVGVATHDLLEAPVAEAPAGWTWRGWDPWRDALVGEHTASGVVAVLNQA